MNEWKVKWKVSGQTSSLREREQERKSVVGIYIFVYSENNCHQTVTRYKLST